MAANRDQVALWLVATVVIAPAVMGESVGVVGGRALGPRTVHIEWTLGAEATSSAAARPADIGSMWISRSCVALAPRLPA